MQKLYKDFKEKIEFIDKFLLLLIISVPFFLATSIFLADLISSIAGIFLIYIFFKKKNYFFERIKTEIIFMVIFYLIILTSLLLTEYFKNSFLASFFYFRYFLLSLSIYYLLIKYDFFIRIFSYSLIFTILVVLIDGFIQYFYGSNIFGYDSIGRKGVDKLSSIRITGFFDQEKKLGSYLIRFLPLVLAVIFWFNKRKSDLLSISLIIFIGSAIFLTSERTALFIYFIVTVSFFIISKHKFIFLLLLISTFTLLFSLNLGLKHKFINSTINQILDTPGSVVDKDINKPAFFFYSFEHENLIYTSIKIFKENFLFGSGVKTFYHECHNLKKNELKELAPTKRGNKLVCSTHPHSTYFQLLSDVGIFGFLIIFIYLCHIIGIIFKMLFKGKKEDSYFLSYYFINIGMLINLFPLIPSGSFFNNWICLIIFYLFGFWLFLKSKYLKKNI
jgi:O-antigen ligase